MNLYGLYENNYSELKIVGNEGEYIKFEPEISGYSGGPIQRTKNSRNLSGISLNRQGVDLFNSKIPVSDECTLRPDGQLLNPDECNQNHTSKYVYTKYYRSYAGENEEDTVIKQYALPHEVALRSDSRLSIEDLCVNGFNYEAFKKWSTDTASSWYTPDTVKWR